MLNRNRIVGLLVALSLCGSLLYAWRHASLPPPPEPAGTHVGPVGPKGAIVIGQSGGGNSNGTVQGIDGGYPLTVTGPPSGIAAYGQVTITGGATAATLTGVSTICSGGIDIRNLDATNKVYRGKDTSTTNSTGVPLYAGETWSADRSWDISTGPYLYAPITIVVAYECLK